MPHNAEIRKISAMFLRNENREDQLRQDLSIAYKLTSKFNMDELIWNHISARLGNDMLITPGNIHFSQITPDKLVRTSMNMTANIIHEAIYDARSDINALVHLHTPASVAIASLKEGFMPIAQESAYFYNKVAYYDWAGMSTSESEKAFITKAAEGDANIIILRNHGFCALGRTVAEA